MSNLIFMRKNNNKKTTKSSNNNKKKKKKKKIKLSNAVQEIGIDILYELFMKRRFALHVRPYFHEKKKNK